MGTGGSNPACSSEESSANSVRDMRGTFEVFEAAASAGITGDGFETMKPTWECLPDLILMDIQLPEISGLDVTRRLKGDERSQNIPIIAVTALAMGWHEKEALDSGCDAYISKPFSISDFLHTVGSFLPRFPH